jgi:hypothetical protein
VLAAITATEIQSRRFIQKLLEIITSYSIARACLGQKRPKTLRWRSSSPQGDSCVP